MAYTTTTKWLLRKLTGGSLISEIDAGFDALAEDLDPLLTPYDAGALASRPVSTVGTPGKAGRTYRATDTGAVYLDTGIGWITVALGIGEIREWSGATAPDNWFLLDGSEKDIATYGVLYAIVGTTYGALTNGSGGAGSSHFRLPDARGRTTIAAGTATGAAGATAHALGQKAGEETHLLSLAEIPAHQHQVIESPFYFDYAYEGVTGADGLASGRVGSGAGGTAPPWTMTRGGGGSHQNMQPFLALNKIIRAL